MVNIRSRATIGIVASAICFALVSLLVIRTSSAAFSATTANEGNSILTGDVALSDDDSDVALFSVSDFSPGDAETACLTVSYDGSLNPSAVKLYTGPYTDADSLDAVINVTVEVGLDGATCASFAIDGSPTTKTLAAFSTDHTDYSDGVVVWDPSASGEDRPVRFTVELDASADASHMNKAISDLDFTFETQS